VSAAFFVFQGHDYLIYWANLDQYENLKIAIDYFTSGDFNIPIEADAKIVFSFLTGSAPNIDINVVWGFFILANLTLIFALTAFTFLNNWLYYVGSFVVLAAFVYQQPNILFYNQWFSKYTLIAPILLLGGSSYYFFAFASKASFLARFAIISFVAFCYFSGLMFFSGQQLTVLYLTNYGSIAFIVIAIAFIFLISFEIVYLFLSLITNSKGAGRKSGTMQFVAVYVLYTANLLLQYLKNRGVIHFDLMFISPFILLLVSTVVGIWGFKERSEMFKITLPFYPIGALVYLAWATLSAATIAYCFYSGNDPLIEVFEDTVLFTHIGFGFGFFVYVAWNYSEWINTEVQVNKMIYTYRWVSFLTVYATGLLIVISLFFNSNMFIYKQLLAGYYNYLGDVYYTTNELQLAERYYKDAESWEFQNHKTNFTLATIYQRQNRLKDALKYYRNANLKQPSTYAYANLAVMRYLNGNEVEAVLDLRDGLHDFPNSGALKINLGLVYERLHFPDSAFHYFASVGNNTVFSNYALSNQKALLAKYAIANKEKSQQLAFSESSNQLNINVLAYALVSNSPLGNLSLADFSKDSLLDEQRFALVNNYMLKTKSDVKDSNAIGLLKKMIASDSNAFFKTDLLYLKAIADNYRNQPFEAAKAVDLLQLSHESNAGRYLNTLGLWALEQTNGKFAAKIFQLASEKGYVSAKVNKAIALAEAKDFKQMLNTLETVNQRSDTNTFELVSKLVSIAKPLIINNLLLSNDDTKASFLYYKCHTLSPSQNINLFFSIKDVSLRLKAGLAIFDWYLSEKNIALAAEILGELTKDTYSQSQLSTLNLRLLHYLVWKKDMEGLKRAVNTHKLADRDLIYVPYFEAVVAEQKGDNAQAQKKYAIAVRNCAFNQTIVLMASNYFSKAGNHTIAFNMLLDGVAMNPFSAKLWKAYCLESVAFGIPSFGISGLESLKPLVNEGDYEAFKKRYDFAKVEFTSQLLGL